jgi:hypothetical protein
VADPPETGDPGVPARTGRRWRFELWAFLELFGLCGFVVVQPLLDVVGRSPDFFIFHGVSSGGIVLLLALVVLVPPVGLWAVGALAGLAGRPARAAVHVASVAGLFALFMIQLGKYLTPTRGAVLVVLAALATAVITVGYLWLPAARQLLRFAAVGPLVFALLFTFASPSSAVVFSAGTPGTGGQARVVGPNPPIVMIVLDELSLVSLLDGDGGIDRERFPNVADLAGDATWYRNATSPAGWTPYAVPSMLTGRWPAEHLAPNYAAYPDNLFTLLGDVYRIEASESITQLCPPWHCGDGPETARGGLPVALAESTSLLGEILSPGRPAGDPYDDYAEPTVRDRLEQVAQARLDAPQSRFVQAFSDNQPVRFREFIDGLRSGDPAAEAAAPRLHFLHLLLPHVPWTYLPDGTRYQSARGLPVDGPWWARLAQQRYTAQLRYTDALLGETLGTMRSTGLYDDALVVLTSDHGLRLTPGVGGGDPGAGDRRLGPDGIGAEELAWVPLFVKAPGQVDGRVDDRNWQHVDLLPTIAEHAGVEVPWPVDGTSGLAAERTGTDKTFVSELDDRRVLDGDALFARILSAPHAYPPVPPAPLPELVGTAVAGHPVVEGRSRAEVEEAGWFDDVDLDGGTVPALVSGTVPEEVAEGTPLAIAVNGRIGAVVPVVAEAGGVRRFAGLVEDATLFRPGANRLELFLVPDGVTLHRL